MDSRKHNIEGQALETLKFIKKTFDCVHEVVKDHNEIHVCTPHCIGHQLWGFGLMMFDGYLVDL